MTYPLQRLHIRMPRLILEQRQRHPLAGVDGDKRPAQAMRRYQQFGLDIEDAEQECLLAMLKALRKGTPPQYLRMACRSHLFHVYRDQTTAKRGGGKVALSLDSPEPETGDTLVEHLEATQHDPDAPIELGRVLPFLRAMKPHERSALLMDAYGYPARLIAKAINRPANQIANLRRRGVEKVRKMMGCNA